MLEQNLIISLPNYPKFCWYATGTTHIFHLGLSQKHSRKIFFFQNSKLALPGVIIKIWSSQYYKKEKIENSWYFSGVSLFGQECNFAD